jgi:ubiquinone/menaquinone biosynthesis C-methylase UbiE
VKARLYDIVTGRLDRAGFAARRERLVGELDGEVLEVGAGTGLNLAHYRRADRVTAMEPDARYARRLRARAGDARVPVEVVEASAEAIPLPDNSVDHVVTSIALFSVTDLDASLAEIWRVLRLSGTFEFLEHVRGQGRIATWQDRLTPLHRRMVDGCHLNRDPASAIRRTGFRIERLEHFSIPAGHPLISTAIQGSAVKDPAASA